MALASFFARMASTSNIGLALGKPLSRPPTIGILRPALAEISLNTLRSIAIWASGGMVLSSGAVSFLPPPRPSNIAFNKRLVGG